MGHLPINSSMTYSNTDKPYDVSKVMNENDELVQDRYEEYSPVFFECCRDTEDWDFNFTVFRCYCILVLVARRNDMDIDEESFQEEALAPLIFIQSQ